VAHVEKHFGPQVADRVLLELHAAFRLLAENPSVGHRREDLTADRALLFWSVGPTLIAYRPAQGRIDILFIERAEVDWERLMERDF
jgi:plasmid stabilization system protein ParE